MRPPRAPRASVRGRKRNVESARANALGDFGAGRPPQLVRRVAGRSERVREPVLRNGSTDAGEVDDERGAVNRSAQRVAPPGGTTTTWADRRRALAAPRDSHCAVDATSSAPWSTARRSWVTRWCSRDSPRKGS